MTSNQSNSNEVLSNAETGVDDCPNFQDCQDNSSCELELSSIPPDSDRRGSRDPRILLITEAPDKQSSEGTAYSGTISGRIIKMFCDEKYGIQLESPTQDTFSDFLVNSQIYATSAVKCYVSKKGSHNISNHVISSCFDQFLLHQIEAMGNLRIVIAMGTTAASAILDKDPSEFQVTNKLGPVPTEEVRREIDDELQSVIFPHPSGANPYSNPPLIKEGYDKDLRESKKRFQNALHYTRATLDDLGYNVATSSPEDWCL